MSTHGFREYIEEAQYKAIKALEEALKQEQGEPVATDWEAVHEKLIEVWHRNISADEALDEIQYLIKSTPQPSKPLTDERIDEMWAQHCVVWKRINKTLINPIVFARAIEAAHGIKE